MPADGITNGVLLNDESTDTQFPCPPGVAPLDGDGLALIPCLTSATAPTAANKTAPNGQLLRVGTLWRVNSPLGFYILVDNPASGSNNATWQYVGSATGSISSLKWSSWYNNATQLVTATSTVALQVAAFTNAAFTKSAAHEVTVNIAGDYWVESDVSGQSAGNSCYANCWFERAPAATPTAFVEVAGTRGILGGSGTNNGSTASIRGAWSIAAGDVIRLRCQKINGANLNILSNGCRFMIREVR